MTKGRIPLFVVVGLLCAADTPENTLKKEKARLVCTWQLVSVELNEQKVPAETLKDCQVIFTTDSFTRKKGEQVLSEARYKLELTKSPKWLDLIGMTDGKEEIMRGIYELEGDTLTLCFRADAPKQDGTPNEVQKRPEEIVGAKGSAQVLMVLKRVKP